MPVLERAELEESPLADLHAIADQFGLEGFRRMRKADLIDAILGGAGGEPGASGDSAADEESGEETGDAGSERRARPRRRRGRRSARAESEEQSADASEDSPQGSGEDEDEEEADAQASGGKMAKGVVEVLGNGSAFLRVSPPEPSDADVYISAAQVRRCELVTGDEVSGPVRTPRRSERYPSLVRVEEINGAPADTVSNGARYEDLPVAWPSERLELGSGDATLGAIEWLAPIGLGSRVTVVGDHHSGKSETLRRLLAALGDREGLEVSLVLAGARPEEIADWSEGPVQPTAAVSFAAPADAQGQAVDRALDAAKRLAARGSNAVVLIDSLDGLSAHVARRALAAARNLRDAGSLTVIAAASEPLGAETTVIALDSALAAAGREPILDLPRSWALRPELLVGEDGARAMVQARAAALE